jgi:hypothetical protein
MYYRIESKWPQAKGMIKTHISSGFADRKMAESAAAGHAKQGALSVEISSYTENKEDILKQLDQIVTVLNMMIKGSNTENEFNENTGILNSIGQCISSIEGLGE